MGACVCCCAIKLVMNGNLCRCLLPCPFCSAARCAFNSHKISIVILPKHSLRIEFSKPKSIHHFFSADDAAQTEHSSVQHPNKICWYRDEHYFHIRSHHPKAYVTEPILTILLTIIGIDAIIVVCRKWCSYTSCAVPLTLHATYHTSLSFSIPIPFPCALAYECIWESNTWP